MLRNLQINFHEYCWKKDIIIILDLDKGTFIKFLSILLELNQIFLYILKINGLIITLFWNILLETLIRELLLWFTWFDGPK